LCGAWAAAMNFNGWVVVAVLAFVLGYCITSLVMSVVESAVCTTYVCWSQDPAALQQNRPEAFQRMVDAGSHKYAQYGINNYNGQQV
jgi:hypothetical protein